MNRKLYTGIMLVICTTLAFAASSVAPNVGLTWLSNTNPTLSPGVNAPLDQFLIRTDSPSIYYKSGPGPTQWTLIGSDGSSSGFVPSSRAINTVAPILGGGTLATDLTLSMATNGITNSLFRQSGATSVVGRSANSTGNVADISATLDNTVLGRSGGALSFFDPATIPSIVPSTRTISTTAPIAGGGDLSANRTFSLNTNGITNALFRQSAGVSVVANATGSTANVADLTASGDGQVLQRSAGALVFATIAAASLPAFTGDVTTSAGSTVTTIAANAVTNADIRQSAGVSVIGRSANSTGNVADITAGADGTVLARTSGTLSFVDASTVVTVPNFGLFGTGVDGTCTFDGATTITLFNGATIVPSSSIYQLPQDVFCTTATVSVGVEVQTKGFHLQASTSLVNNGKLTSNGGNGGNGGGSGGTAGQTPYTSAFFLQSANGNVGGGPGFGTGQNGGQVGVAPFGFNAASAAAGANGNSPGGGAGGGAGGGTSGTGGAVVQSNANDGGIFTYQRLYSLANKTGSMGVLGCVGAGGGGGGGGASVGGGGGGAGGGTLWIGAKSITGSGTYESKGGNGGNSSGGGNGGGGGGGGGGCIIVLYQVGLSVSALAALENVNGGTGGTGATGSGGTGGTGTKINSPIN